MGRCGMGRSRRRKRGKGTRRRKRKRRVRRRRRRRRIRWTWTRRRKRTLQRSRRRRSARRRRVRVSVSHLLCPYVLVLRLYRLLLHFLVAPAAFLPPTAVRGTTDVCRVQGRSGQGVAHHQGGDCEGSRSDGQQVQPRILVRPIEAEAGTRRYRKLGEERILLREVPHQSRTARSRGA